MRFGPILAAATMALLAAACAAPRAAVAPAPDYAALLGAPGRPAEDAKDDANRKPAEILAFARILTGQTVFEIEAGTGYYTELVSRAVGPSGKVIMQSPPEFETFYKDGLAARLKDGRLANVRFSASRFDALDAPSGTIDVATWFLGPHEVFFSPPNDPDGLGDPAKSYAEVFRVLKPGGYFIVLDHAAPVGAPTTTGGTTHRIDPAVVKASAAAAGFVLEEESLLLANPRDDRTRSAFDPELRRRTDQFLLRYRKPK